MKGRMLYVPKLTINTLEDIKREKKTSNAEALKQMAKYAEVGREIDRLYCLDFRKLRLPSLSSVIGFQRRRK